MIAVTAAYLLPALSVPLFVAAALLALIRVLGGIHYPRDVFCGALFALIARRNRLLADPLKNRKTGTDPDTIGSCFCLPYSPAASKAAAAGAASKATAPVASAETSAPESAAASEAAAPVTASAKASAAKPAAASETAAPVAASAETAAAESTKTASKAAAPMVIAVVAVRRLRPGRRRAVAHMPPPENRTVDHRRHAHAGCQ